MAAYIWSLSTSVNSVCSSSHLHCSHLQFLPACLPVARSLIGLFLSLRQNVLESQQSMQFTFDLATSVKTNIKHRDAQPYRLTFTPVGKLEEPDKYGLNKRFKHISLIPKTCLRCLRWPVKITNDMKTLWETENNFRCVGSCEWAGSCSLEEDRWMLSMSSNLMEQNKGDEYLCSVPVNHWVSTQMTEPQSQPEWDDNKSESDELGVLLWSFYVITQPNSLVQ